MVPLSVLDVVPIVSGSTCTESIQRSLELARRVDELGYTRYWVAEHHNAPSATSSSPEVLIARIAATTKRMRVGSGGIMLPNHSPFRILETFRTLEAMSPGRIDLGIGRALGADPVTSSALRRRPEGDDIDAQLAELLAFATKDFPEGHPFLSIQAMPSDVKVPPMWMLGSTVAGAAVAAAMGVGFAFAGHFNMLEAPRSLEVYRSQFKPSAEVREPRVIMSAWVICGDTDAEAEELATPLRLASARLATGVRAPFPTAAEADEHRFTAPEIAAILRFNNGLIAGGPSRVRERLEGLAEETGASEIIIATTLPDPAERIRSFERIAKLARLTQ